MGFAKGFGYGNITQLTKEVSKTAGAFWFLTAILFIITMIMLLFKKEWWPVIGIVAAILSQILIFTAWKDAKIGTIANIIVLLVAIPAYGNFRFQRMTNREANELLSNITVCDKSVVTKEMINELPSIVRNWLTLSGVIEKEMNYFVRLKQKGEMRSKPGGKWMNFKAEQYFTPLQPAFIWTTRVQMWPLIYIKGRDKFTNGQGEMLIKALSLINVVNEAGDIKMNESTMLRYLAEICWFPSAALSDYITWETVDAHSAKATMNYKGVTVSGVFQFNENSDMVTFSANRYYGNGPKATLERWLVEAKAYKEYDGLRIPWKSKVS